MIRKVAKRINFKDLEDLLPDDFTDESDDYQESAVSNILVLLSEEETQKQERFQTAIDILKIPKREIGIEDELPNCRPQARDILKPEFFDFNRNFMIKFEDNQAYKMDSSNIKQQSCLEDSDQEKS